MTAVKKAPVKKAPEQKTAALLISTKKGVTSFWRAGRKFTETPASVPLAELTDDQIAALKAEPRLIVKDA